jgi:multidrug resistance protein
MGLEWGVSQTALLIGTTTYCTGFAIAPMILAPLSEIKGRKPIFLFSGFVFTISQLGCGVTTSYAGLLVARFFAGVGSSTFSTIVGGIVADIYHKEERNTPMAVFAGAAFFGSGIGPLFSEIIAFHLPWRWVFYVQAISCGVLAVASAWFFEETRENVLLSRKAKALNEWYDECETAGMVGVIGMHGDCEEKHVKRIRWTVTVGDQTASLAQVVRISLERPVCEFLLLRSMDDLTLVLDLLFTEPIVFWMSMWIAFAWAVLYLSFASIPIVFGDAYGFNSQQTGAVFTSKPLTLGLFDAPALLTDAQSNGGGCLAWSNFKHPP